VLASGLRGRGGAGFPAARKWEAAVAAGGPRYLIANGDEGDPGSYADRLLMERDPHGVLEGMALAALACGADRGYAYVRSEYPRARAVMETAVAEARAAGDLGAGFDVEVFEGAGSYVAGEETSLIHSLEGLRGAVLARPPFPTENGLYDRPTVVNNVETLSAVPWIAANGGAAYARLGTEQSKGTKLVCLNERFERPGVYEVEFGTSLREICEGLGGGLKDGAKLRSLQVGGPLGGFLGPEQLDVPLTFEDLAAQGVDLGHGGIVAFDERVPGPELLRHVWRFLSDESCGTCFPCRIGSRRGYELAERVGVGPVTGADGALQDELLDTMGAASLCAFGRSAPMPVRTLMAVYADELAPRGGG
jgi:NADH-quinone oxidoreductase subunit F